MLLLQQISRDHVYRLLQSCSNLKMCRDLQSLTVDNGLDCVAVLADHIIRLFFSFGRLVEARQVFNRVKRPTQYTWCAVIEANAKLGNENLVYQLHDSWKLFGGNSNKYIFIGVLKACITEHKFEQGKVVHEEIIESGLIDDPFVGVVLVDMYAKCANFEEVHRVFNSLENRDMVSWCAMIALYVQHGEYLLALDCFENMQHVGIEANKFSLSSVLKSCSNMHLIEEGRRIHAQIIQSGLQVDAIVGSALVDMYAKCESLEEALKAFNALETRDVVAWGVMIGGCVHNGQNLLALEYFGMIQHEGIMPDKVTFSSVLKACSSITAIEQGKLIHEQIIQSGCQFDAVVSKMLVNMYFKCGDFPEACRAFHNMPTQDAMLWGAMIAGCIYHNKEWIALQLYSRMHHEGIKPEAVTYLNILKASASLGCLEQARVIHELILVDGLQFDITIGNKLVDMYSKCGSIEEAREVFNKLPNRDIVSWTLIITGYAEHGEGFCPLECFDNMRHEGIMPDHVIILSALKACKSLETGRLIHSYVIEVGLWSDIAVGNSLLDMYMKRGQLDEACKSFNILVNRDIISWGTMIGGYVQHEDARLAIECFYNMRLDGIVPDKIIFLSTLKACGKIGATLEGRCIHEQVIHCNLQHDIMIGNTLVDMYFKGGSIDEACNMFNNLLDWNVVSCSTMIAGCAQYGKETLALNCFEDMQCSGIKPDGATYVSIMKVYSHLGTLQECRYIHNQIVESGLQSDVIIGSMLVNMYANCGIMEEASRVFHSLPRQNVVSWDAIINGYAQLGNIKMARQYFDKMQDNGMKPDHSTIMNILSACNHVGLVDEGRGYYKSMNDLHGILPDWFHHTCMVDLLGRVGCFKEAQGLVRDNLPCNACGWISLLSACKSQGNFNLGRVCFDEIVSTTQTC